MNVAKPLLDKVLKALEKSDTKYGALVERIMKGGSSSRLTPEEVRQFIRPDIDRETHDEFDWRIRRNR